MLFDDAKTIRVRAIFLGSRIDTRAFETREPLALAPLTVRAGARGCAVLFRFGVAALVEVTSDEEKVFLDRLLPFVSGRFTDPQREDTEVVVDPACEERVDSNGVLALQEASLERLQVVTQVLAKSTVLAHYEERVANVFDRIERLAERLRGQTKGRISDRDLLREIGDVLLTQTWTVGRVEVTEKPEITWDHSELDRLYERLAIEYELRDRDIALERKLELISRTVQTYLDLLQNRRSLRVEWYIVILIFVEIVLILYDIFLAS